MGSASRVTPGRPHNDSLAASLPIENSPPGIQAMPSGADAGAGVLLGMVGTNMDADENASAFADDGASGFGRVTFHTNADATAVVTMNHGHTLRTGLGLLPFRGVVDFLFKLSRPRSLRFSTFAASR